MNWLLHLLYIIVDTVFLQASTISAVLMAGERFYAVYWPLKHRALSTRTYRTVIVTAWITALVVSLIYDCGIHHMRLQYRCLEKV